MHCAQCGSACVMLGWEHGEPYFCCPDPQHGSMVFGNENEIMEMKKRISELEFVVETYYQQEKPLMSEVIRLKNALANAQT